MSDYQSGETANWNAAEVRAAAERRAAEPPRPHRHRRGMGVLQYFLFVILVSAVLAGVGWLLINDFCSLNKKEVNTTVEITAEDNVGSIAGKLHDAGLIKYPWFFRFFAAVDRADQKIGIGTYKLNSSMDYLALITAMHNSSGSLGTDTVRITIPEGYTVSQILTLLASKGVNTQDALAEAAQTGTFDYDFVSKDSQELSRLEGYLFPDTYDFYLNEKPAAALNRLLANFSAKMDTDRTAAVKASPYSLKEIITIASLIEKETDGSDQKNIASVIYNRLSDSGSHGTYKKLQIDASLLYALPDHTGAITNADKKVDSPYNLYTHEGLPPTPIANPGLTAIDAALNPASTDYYYYGLGKDGVHHYFATYDEFQNFLNSDAYGG